VLAKIQPPSFKKDDFSKVIKMHLIAHFSLRSLTHAFVVPPHTRVRVARETALNKKGSKEPYHRELELCD
jgi:hypothetical protein